MKSKLYIFILYILFSSCKNEVKKHIKEEVKNDLKETVEKINENKGRFEIVNSNFEFIYDENVDINNFNRAFSSNNTCIKFSIELKNISEDVLPSFSVYSLKTQKSFSYNEKIEYDGEGAFKNAKKYNFFPETKNWKPNEINKLEGILATNVGKSKYETNDYWSFNSFRIIFTLSSSTPIANSGKLQELPFDLTEEYKNYLAANKESISNNNE